MKGAIFDVDGTLLDSMTVWWNITDTFFKNRNLVLTDENAAMYKEMTLEESLPAIIEEFKLEMTFDEIMEEFRQMVEREYLYNIGLKPGAEEYLRRLHTSGVRTAVATSGYAGLCKPAFKRLGIYEYIDEYAFSGEVGCNKGKPDVYLLAAERIGVKPSDCTVFEDIALGIDTAKKAGFKTCAIYDPTNSDETELLKRLSDKYIACWNELL